jgi:hypothetical protein
MRQRAAAPTDEEFVDLRSLAERELDNAVSWLRRYDRPGSYRTLSDGRRVTYRGGPFSSCEIAEPDAVQEGDTEKP